MKILKMWVFRSRKSKNDILPWPNQKKREKGLTIIITIKKNTAQKIKD